MGRARILMDAAVGKPERSWAWEIPFYSMAEVKAGSGMDRAKKLQRLTGAKPMRVVSGREAYSKAERARLFKHSRALAREQVESGDFEVIVLEW